MLSPSATNIQNASTLPPPSFDALTSTAPKPSTPTRPKHTLSRSISELSPPMMLKHHHPHLHRHHHRDRDLVIDTRSEVVTPAGSRHGSRRPSLNGRETAESTIIPPGANLPGVPREWERRPVKPEELSSEREKSVARATELKKALMDMIELSNTTTRRLDTTYYSVLEKVSSLTSTIAALKELALMSRELKGEFEKEGKEIVNELGAQLDGFNDFKEQQAKIEGLESRIKRGRERVEKLGERVDVVKGKIVVWERLEGQWQSRMRQRMKIIWSITAVILLIGLGLVLYQYTPARTSGPATLRGFNISNLTEDLPDLKETMINETLNFKRKASDALEALKSPPQKKELEDNPVLRAFDEL